MTIYEAIEKRKSIRHFTKKRVEQEKIDRLIKAAAQAPTGRNKQGWRFLQIREQDTKALLAHEASHQKFLEKAPVIIVCCTTNGNDVYQNGHSQGIIDTAIAVDHITLAAVEEGLATCWVSNFNTEQVKEILRIPEEIDVIEMVALGYPEQEESSLPRDHAKIRRPLEEILFSERWPS